MNSVIFISVVLVMLGFCGWAAEQTYVSDDPGYRPDVRWLFRGGFLWILAMILPPPDLPITAFTLILIGGPVTFSAGFLWTSIRRHVRTHRTRL